MSKWAGKFVIGLTGNIGTGKSVVRRMLEHLGAYGIDADALGHRAVAKGAPAYQPVVETFGRWILGADGQIDRNKLARTVFNDPDALAQLEKIVHPLVDQAVDVMIKRASQPVIVVEAIKLIEAGMDRNCDSLWTVYAPPELQLARLMQNRHMGEDEARQRIAAQPSQDHKIAAARVIIKNIGPFEDTWKQVSTAWQQIVPAPEATQTLSVVRQSASAAAPTTPSAAAPAEEMAVVRGKPRNSADIADLVNRLRKDRYLQRSDVMAAFGEKAFLLLRVGDKYMGVIGWQVENLVSRATDMVVDPNLPADQALSLLVNEMENASKDLQCEASLIFVSPDLAKHDTLWRKLGYERRTPQNLGVLAWEEAAQESMPPDTVLYFKQLRQDRVLRPI